MVAFVNDRFIPSDEAAVPVTDLAVQRGYGVFDYFRSEAGLPVFLEDHLDRFYASAKALYLQVPYDRAALRDILSELHRRNNLLHCGTRMILTGGHAPDSMTIGTPHLIIVQQPLSLPGQEHFIKGCALITYEHQRQLPSVKTIDYLVALWLQERIRAAGADDVLYHRSGRISECPRANIFMVTPDDVLVTPADDILYGVVRKQILQMAAGLIKAEERPIEMEELFAAKEIFITSTTKQVLPVRKLDEHLLPPANPVAGKLLEMLRARSLNP